MPCNIACIDFVTESFFICPCGVGIGSFWTHKTRSSLDNHNNCIGFVRKNIKGKKEKGENSHRPKKRLTLTTMSEIEESWIGFIVNGVDFHLKIKSQLI
jgi:hypothetical protein